MNAYDSMVSVLRPTGLYALNGNTAVDFELQAYAAALDSIYNAVTLLQNESFAATAADYGLELRKRQFCLSAGGSQEEMRASILGLGAVTPADFTLEGVRSALSAAGLDCEICEDAAAQKLYLNCPMEFANEPMRGKAVGIAKLFLPAHLGAELDFRSISWNNIDGYDNAYDTVDALDLTWDAADGYQGAVTQI